MNKHNFRPSWDDVFMTYAMNVATRSCDPKHKIGCVIVNKDNSRILSFGYNGDEHGGTNKRESNEVGGSGFIHAEENALIKLDYSEPYKKVYITHSPCIMCAKKLINAKVDEIIYNEIYDINSLKWLSEHPVGRRIKIRKYEQYNGRKS